MKKNYKTPDTVSTKPKHPGITFPEILTPNTGIHIIERITGTRYKVWYHVDGKKRYLSLPNGITLTEARTRRDTLYKNLKTTYGAKKRKPRTANSRPSQSVIQVDQKTYLYRIPAMWGVRIRGKHIGKHRDLLKAGAIRDAWLKENADLVPHVLLGWVPGGKKKGRKS